MLKVAPFNLQGATYDPNGHKSKFFRLDGLLLVCIMVGLRCACCELRYDTNDFKSSNIKIQSENCITLNLIGAELQVTVKVYEKFLLACPSFSDRGNVREIKWYRCSPRNNDCDTDWRDFQIAYVDSMNETKADIPNFDVYTNGTLVIKMVQPTDDGVMFICSAEKYYAERIQNTTILNIAQGDAYICV